MGVRGVALTREAHQAEPAELHGLEVLCPDDLEQMTAFMQLAGYVLVENVFSDGEVAMLHAMLRKEAVAVAARAGGTGRAP